MFADVRSKKIFFLSHCILNQNSISDGTAEYPAVNQEILELLFNSGAGIVQMPCPELNCLGLDRGDIHGGERDVVVENTRIRHSLKQPAAAELLNNMVHQVVSQIEEYQKYGFSILGIIGINRSPSCGVETTSDFNREVQGRGVFMEMLENVLDEKEIRIDMIGVKALETEDALNKIRDLLFLQA